jgi:hypothetical protein
MSLKNSLPMNYVRRMAALAVWSELVSALNSLITGKIQGTSTSFAPINSSL